MPIQCYIHVRLIFLLVIPIYDIDVNAIYNLEICNVPALHFNGIMCTKEQFEQKPAGLVTPENGSEERNNTFNIKYNITIKLYFKEF